MLIKVGFALGFLAPIPAAAANYVGIFSGRVESINLPASAQSDGSIAVGDIFDVSLSIDTSTYAGNAIDENGSMRAVYAVPFSYSLRLGNYTRSGAFSNYSLVISNNQVISPYLTSDGISFALVGGFIEDSPYTFAAGEVFSTFSLTNFDQDLTKLNGVGFDQLPKLASLANKSAEISFHNSASGSNVYIRIGQVSGSVSESAVPEPATWALMISGFGAVGWSLRRRRTGEASLA